MILDRRWSSDWDYGEALLEGATARLADLYQAAGRAGPAGDPAAGEVRRLLAADLDVPAALEVAIAEGGAPARLLIATLGLD
jgi:L-cysteine:1D-myo-inositol 2-amino-2-deoxy-alpha-D-glucopyranoside ligase